VPGQLGHERADDGAVAGEDRLDRDRTVVDPLHHLDLVADDVAPMPLPTGLVVDEEGGLARVAVGRLHDEVGAEASTSGRLEQLVVFLDGHQHIRHARRADLVAQPGGDELGVQLLPELR
jgi:hypothetical protein